MPEARISGSAHLTLARLARAWSGWDDMTLEFDTPEGSPHGALRWSSHTITLNPDTLLLNPNKVLRNATPFRLRQEAVLTGALMHECAHARYSKWLPRTPEAVELFCHSDGEIPSEPTVALARLVEEARIEGAFAEEAASIHSGTESLTWAFRAMAAHLVPFTEVSTDPDQAIMDLITSWVLRAGRVHASPEMLPEWVKAFDRFLVETVADHLDSLDDATQVWNLLGEMLIHRRHTGPFMVDTARDILSLLFPDTPSDEMPSAGGAGCSDGDDDEGQASPGSPESDDQDEAGGSDQPEADEAGEGDGGMSDFAAALAAMESEADGAIEAEASEQQADEAPVQRPTLSAGAGSTALVGVWRQPNSAERAFQRGAEEMLRDLVNPSESSKVSLTDTPSAQVDGAALAAWKASGGTREPHFFRRTRREIEPEPPVQIAILVDVSQSMASLQYPSALLSWALASAAFDLRNFAGRGAQVASTLIHWGDQARVVQPNGSMLPGMREVRCTSGTSALDDALALVERQIPGFFEPSERPVNRLLVQFTDWMLDLSCREGTLEYLTKALGVGVNMISVVPSTYSARSSALPKMLSEIKVQRGRSEVVRYNKDDPAAVWTEAKKILTRC